jgi:3-hydroxybutyryl-CoA dehydrogenase
LSNIQTIAVIGAGPLGRRLAAICCQVGYRTILEDVLPSNLRKAKEQVEEVFATRPGIGTSPGRVEFANSVEDAVRDADLIIDCVPDELESKLEIFSLLDRMAPPRSILATPTRALSIADLASCTYRAERCVALELPPELLGSGDLPRPWALTVVHTSRTLPEVMRAVIGFGESLGLEIAVRADTLESTLDGTVSGSLQS